ncbi:MAG: hypothetical protein KDC98_22505, partial [Planctomycetes bacterium]|nr:hypothetical protein [Planctomycetota bacterium]
MSRPLRLRLLLLSSLFPLFGSACQAPPRTSGPEFDARQIHWQRSIDDALAIARAEGRPLLLALNMDGESASDRIVHEQYRDPAFVAGSRRYVCLVASLFRHNAQDYDENGRRIPCPRLGCVTCGEHIALEPLLYERFLSDGERVAPRHAAVAADGRKLWDLSLSFDLQDIDRAVLATAASAPASRVSVLAADWAALAAGRGDHERRRLENALDAALDLDDLTAGLAAISSHGDAGSLDALRLIAHRLPELSPALRDRFAATVAALKLGPSVATALREFVQTLGPGPGAAPPAAAVWLAMLAAVDGDGAATRAFLIACTIAGYPGAAPATRTAFGAEPAAAIMAAIDTQGGPLDWDAIWHVARQTRDRAAGAPPLPGYDGDTLAEADQLLRDLEQLDHELRDRPDDAALRARFALASLQLARCHLATRDNDVPL